MVAESVSKPSGSKEFRRTQGLIGRVTTFPDIVKTHGFETPQPPNFGGLGAPTLGGWGPDPNPPTPQPWGAEGPDIVKPQGFETSPTPQIWGVGGSDFGGLGAGPQSPNPSNFGGVRGSIYCFYAF